VKPRKIMISDTVGSASNAIGAYSAITRSRCS
jgi:hypothetical protein